MTLFEYIAIATSLILSFSLARLLTNLAPVFASERRDWVHGTWVLILMFNHATLFWQLWLYQDADAWMLVDFLILLLGPIMLLIGASLLVPAEPAPDYRRHFESIRVPLYGVLTVAQLQNIPLLYRLFEVPLIHQMHLSNLVLAAVFLAALAARKRAVDAALVCFFVIAVLGGSLLANDHEAMRALMESMLK